MVLVTTSSKAHLADVVEPKIFKTLQNSPTNFSLSGRGTYYIGMVLVSVSHLFWAAGSGSS